MDPRRLTATAIDFAKAAGDTLCALADSLLHRQCVPRSEHEQLRSLHDDVRVERDAAISACRFALGTIDEQHAEIAQLRVLAGAPLDDAKETK